MRAAVAALFLCFTTGCDDSPPPPDRVEIRLSGWSAADIEVDRAGRGSYRLDRGRHGNRGTFSLSPPQLEQLLRRLEPYRRQAVPPTEESMAEFIIRDCPRDVPFVTDSGAVYIRWIGPGSDLHFLADLGCDHERQASRNKDLLGIVYGLPVPLS